RDVEQASHGADAKSAAAARVAFGGARDGAGPRAPTRPGPPRHRAPIASRLGGLPRGAGARGAALRGDRAGRRRLLRLAGGGAGPAVNLVVRGHELRLAAIQFPLPGASRSATEPTTGAAYGRGSAPLRPQGDAAYGRRSSTATRLVGNATGVAIAPGASRMT